jgi:lipopolysaccharide biosynthesis glycosyltransferase
MASERLTVATVCDNHYIIMLAALIKSIEVNYGGDEKIDLYIINDHIKKQNRQRLTNSVNPEKINLSWVNVSEIIPEDTLLPLDRTSYPANIYARLFIAGWLPERIKRVLYLDVDMIFRKDISALWNTDIEGKTIGAVIDKSMTMGSSWAGIRNYKELDFELLIDTVKWRNSRSTEHILRRISDNLKHADYPDQYGLNVVFAKNWFELNSKWNCQSGTDIEDPFVIHFTGRKPIYNSYTTSRDHNPVYKEEFYRYLRLTEWSGFRGFSKFDRLIAKLNIKFGKIVLYIRQKLA